MSIDESSTCFKPSCKALPYSKLARNSPTVTCVDYFCDHGIVHAVRYLVPESSILYIQYVNSRNKIRGLENIYCCKKLIYSRRILIIHQITSSLLAFPSVAPLFTIKASLYIIINIFYLRLKRRY